jgi:hypothetical protein
LAVHLTPASDVDARVGQNAEEFMERPSRGDAPTVEEAGDRLRVADGVTDVLPEQRGERRHPADYDGGADAVVERGQMAGAQAAHGEADAGEPFRVHLRACGEIVQRADVVPEHHAGPGEAGGVDRPPDSDDGGTFAVRRARVTHLAVR